MLGIACRRPTRSSRWSPIYALSGADRPATGMKRTRLRSRPKDRGTDAALAHAWFVQVCRGKACIVCKKKLRLQAHHVIPQQVIRHEFPFGVVLFGDTAAPVRFLRMTRLDVPEFQHPDGEVRSLQDLLWDVDNGAPVCEEPCHRQHTDHVELIPAEKLSAANFRFAISLGLQHRLGPRYYAGGVE